MSTLHQDYDYIVCGGGTAGPVVAARLAEDPTKTVLLIESGEHNQNLENTQMVGGWSKLLDIDTDWNFVSEPVLNANGRRIKLSRGRYLGGCSGCNGTLVVRGTKQDYDDWGMEGWGGDEFLKYMMKAETFHPSEWFPHNPEAHGTTGPLHTSVHDLAPISKLILDSMQDKGLPLDPDMFANGGRSHGCGHVTRTVWQGIRSTGADFVKKNQPNLTLLCSTMVDKVILERHGGDIRAVGVEVVDKDGIKKTIGVKREVVVSGGAYCSPMILMRSGIGGKEELSKVGIECKVELPGVGKNLQDHLIVFIFYETEKEGLTNDKYLYEEGALEKSYLEWKENKSGVLSSFPFGAFAYARLDEYLKNDTQWQEALKSTKPGRDPMGLTQDQPNIELFSTECYGGPKQCADLPVGGKHAFSIIAELFAPRSRGTVTLQSADPNQKPIIDHNYLSDPLDMVVLSEACRFGNDIIVNGRGTKGITKGSWPTDLTHHTWTNRSQWEDYVREHATTCYHPGGTCKMGTDTMAVLNERLQVHGVKGLRVADASVMPLINNGHTQAPVYGIGEKCADMIKEDAL